MWGTCLREAQILPKGGAELVRERFRSCPKEVQIYSERGSFRSCLKEVQIWKYNDDLCKIVFNFFGHDWEAPFWEYECILRLWKTQTKYEVFLPLLCDGRHDSVHESATAEICFYKTSCQSFPLDAIELMHSKWWCHKAALFNLYKYIEDIKEGLGIIITSWVFSVKASMVLFYHWHQSSSQQMPLFQ